MSKRSNPNGAAEPIFEFEHVCMCGRPKKNARGRCELCKSLGVRNPLAAHQYKWIEHHGCVNPAIKEIGFGKLNTVCGQCIHFNKARVTVPGTFDSEKGKSQTKAGFICKNSTTLEPINAFWPACHNFQERNSKTTAPKHHKLEVHKK